jgi:hypothetical protein
MKTPVRLVSMFFAIVFLAACGFSPFSKEVKLITPSNVIITEERAVSGFTGIDMGAFGRVIISQGETESLTIQGSDNVVPLIETSVRNKVLTIRTGEEVNFVGINEDKFPTLTITVKDLSHLAFSGAGRMTMDALSTDDLDINISGAGEVTLDNLSASAVNVSISGLGGLNLAGEAASARINLSGAGNVNASDLKLQAASITISGLGNAELWVTDRLTGEISGGGSVSYYGEPQANTQTSGMGNFKSMGVK